jgi:hypothetical protein
VPIEISEDWKLSNNIGASGWSREDGMATNALLKAAYGATNVFSHSLGHNRTFSSRWLVQRVHQKRRNYPVRLTK